ncbi:unnamed protein product [Haemonchus placei]|uniref:Adenylate kinase n=1 Tax=Haemonchus placei TaxID=6290 RepID=A0A0N4WVJ4_HAEPC|nr:unnamed protein product [Haemonchus placei]
MARQCKWSGNMRHISELIPNHLALALVKAEMGRHPQASAFLLEGFPREARQVEDFEKQVKSVNMALILDYDEKTLRDHMEKRGVNLEIIDQRIKVCFGSCIYASHAHALPLNMPFISLLSNKTPYFTVTCVRVFTCVHMRIFGYMGMCELIEQTRAEQSI